MFCFNQEKMNQLINLIRRLLNSAGFAIDTRYLYHISNHNPYSLTI